MKWVLATLLGGLLVIQLVPYGRDHDNPPVVAEPSWDSLQTRELTVPACFDCHNNETEWPWYSNVAPVSWLVQRDVDEGRDELNYSEWNRRPQEGEESTETVLEGSMPPGSYLLTHPEARLSDDELAALADGLTATFGGERTDQRTGRIGGGWMKGIPLSLLRCARLEGSCRFDPQLGRLDSFEKFARGPAVVAALTGRDIGPVRRG